MIRAIVIFFAMFLLTSCLSKPNQLNYRDGTEQLALLGIPFWVDDREGTHTELIYGGRSGSEIVIFSAKRWAMTLLLPTNSINLICQTVM